MEHYVTLSGVESQAQALFQQILDKPDQIIILILGVDNAASKASAFAKAIVAALPNDKYSIYNMVVFVILTNPMHILAQLNNLKCHKNVDMNNYTSFTLLSISPFRNIISEGVTAQRFLNGKLSMHTAMLAASANA
jgi:hypothetical protein